MKKSYSLLVEPRTAAGHAVSSLRAAGSIPAVIYGSGMASTNVSVNTADFISLYKEAGETHVINLQLEGVSFPVLIHIVQKHPITREALHIEFLKVNLKEKMKTSVPLSLIGESPAIQQGLGNMLTLVQEIEIEALPNDIPESLSVDVSSLAEVGAEATAASLIVPPGVTLLTAPEEILVKIVALVVEKEPEKTEEPVAEESTQEQAPEQQPAEQEKSA